ncbi:MAG: class I SAM-dependent methyltransferase [Nitrosomonas sp.]|nr:class I SAM-dependent methyltransferase [Burkholderiales bacterium]MCC7090410.1 class I SAM-dependent methyltransferase [Nitrosomonas sp.]
MFRPGGHSNEKNSFGGEVIHHFSGICPVCGGHEFSQVDVLWPELINAWQLSNSEVAYINRQQGFHCKQCFNNLRAMGLAAAILREYMPQDTLKQFCEYPSELSICEVNRAGNLTPFLERLPSHELIEYPQYDMLNLKIESESIDLVIHSDTLEHIQNPERALSECCRVLRKNGRCIFTVPIIVDRMSRSRVGLAPSYHGQSNIDADDQLVWTEFGADMWKFVIGAGFSSCEIFAFEYPAAMVLIAKK